ncbi:Sec-independent protein translocase subunit TatA/TatB [Candidatus Gromoviella agglomerans]|uniref:Sec-independent protein translocase subunit TatA/TatB n=1 Tax=Candidatus Gromoviella agglomerans TaxID=2806609 RepID=UPI001E48D4E0|nr:twin-arginine translocase TatA/TatE family subunit [Candidatus Gromoviella agglomerans]
MLSTSHLILVAFVALLVFGGKRLSGIMREFALGLRYFKRGANDFSRKRNHFRRNR